MRGCLIGAQFVFLSIVLALCGESRLMAHPGHDHAIGSQMPSHYLLSTQHLVQWLLLLALVACMAGGWAFWCRSEASPTSESNS
ncbi:MAG: hypothetical protein KDB22_10755 [Planctomycetales bacterium]|nr:hypothetical protein [Planctomycetales bacterium]